MVVSNVGMTSEIAKTVDLVCDSGKATTPEFLFDITRIGLASSWRWTVLTPENWYIHGFPK
jgi:hypothetical protein